MTVLSHSVTVVTVYWPNCSPTTTNCWYNHPTNPSYPGILPQYVPTSQGDERLLTLTVRHLLQHTAGWDQRLVGDPLMWRGIGKAMGEPEPANQDTVIRYMMGQPLQFNPGRILLYLSSYRIIYTQQPGRDLFISMIYS